MDIKYKGKNYIVNRFPKSTNKSLRPWASADELVLSYMDENLVKADNIYLYNDRFGFFSNVLYSLNPISVVDYKSQERAIIRNQKLNNLNMISINLKPLYNSLKIK